MKTKVYIALVDAGPHSFTLADSSLEGLQAQLAKGCREAWNQRFGDDDGIPDDDKEVVTQYFEKEDDAEAWGVTYLEKEVEVPGVDNGGKWSVILSSHGRCVRYITQNHGWRGYSAQRVTITGDFPEEWLYDVMQCSKDFKDQAVVVRIPELITL